MIHCTINGMTAYPDSTGKIKITRTNKNAQRSDSYTYDVTFPMDIIENRRVFGNLQRLDVSKKTTEYADCIIVADNIEVIRGKGVVTNVTDIELKLQIVCRKLAYTGEQGFDDFIDAISYPQLSWTDRGTISGYTRHAATCPVYSSGDGCILNLPKYLCETSYVGGINEDVAQQWMEYHDNVAVQPRLLSVLESVMRHVGYTLDLEAAGLHESPWQEIHIANPRKGTYQIKDALPHWKVSRFVEEVENLFNITFVYGTWNHEVAGETRYAVAVPRGKEGYLYFDGIGFALAETSSAGAEDYDCIDEYSVDYDDEGLTLTTEANVGYALSGEHDNGGAYIPPAAFRKFEVVYCTHEDDILAIMNDEKQTEQYKLTHIFKAGLYYYYIRNSDDGLELVKCSLFSPIIRDENADTVELALTPCPIAIVEDNVRMAWRQWDASVPDGTPKPTDYDPWRDSCRDNTAEFCIPSTGQNSTVDAEYDTVDDYVQGSLASTTEESDNIELFFLNPEAVYSRAISQDDLEFCWYANGSIYKKWLDVKFTLQYLYGTVADLYGSFELHESVFPNYVGLFHPQEQTIDIHHKTVIKFLADDLPSADSVYVFGNKRFFCEKIEMEVTNGRIDPVKTGYFYEMD